MGALQTVVTPAPRFQPHTSGLLRPLPVFCQADHASLPLPQSETSASVSVEAQFGGSKGCQVHATSVGAWRTAKSNSSVCQTGGRGTLLVQQESRKSGVSRTRWLSTLVSLVALTLLNALLVARRPPGEAVLSVSATGVLSEADDAHVHALPLSESMVNHPWKTLSGMGKVGA